MAYQFKISKAKVESPSFTLTKASFDKLRAISELTNISQARIVEEALKHYAKEAKNEIFNLKQGGTSQKKISINTGHA